MDPLIGLALLCLVGGSINYFFPDFSSRFVIANESKEWKVRWTRYTGIMGWVIAGIFLLAWLVKKWML